MAPKVTVLKVSITCNKCKVKLLKGVAGLEGVDKIETDEEKSTLTVTGTVDPSEIIVCARKAGGCAEVVSVSDPKKPDEVEKKVDDVEDKCPHPCCNNSMICYPNYTAPYNMPYSYSDPSCAIM